MQAELVRRAQRGDEEAFAALVPPAAHRLLGVAYRILRDADLAEDATQQALLVAWRRLPTLRDPERFDAWTYRLVVNACYAETRRRPGNPGRHVIRPDQEDVYPDATTVRGTILGGHRCASLDFVCRSSSWRPSYSQHW